MKHLRFLPHALLIAAACVLTGCGTTGEPTLPTLNQQAGAATQSCTAAVDTATDLLRARKITLAQNAQVVGLCDGVVKGYKAARELVATNPAAAKAEADAAELKLAQAKQVVR